MVDKSTGFPYVMTVSEPDGTLIQRAELTTLPAVRQAFSDMKLQIAKGREVIVKDSDDWTVFHAKDKEVLWPKRSL